MSMAVIRGNWETDFCLGFVAQWFVNWYTEFDPRHSYRSVFSHFLFLFGFVVTLLGGRDNLNETKYWE